MLRANFTKLYELLNVSLIFDELSHYLNNFIIIIISFLFHHLHVCFGAQAFYMCEEEVVIYQKAKCGVSCFRCQGSKTCQSCHAEMMKDKCI